MNIGELSFTFIQMLSLVGIFQCVYVLVHVQMRAGFTTKVVVPSLYFLFLAFAFITDFAQPYLNELTPFYSMISWYAWFAILPLSFLLVIQMADMRAFPKFRYWLVLLFLPASLLTSYVIIKSYFDENCLLAHLHQCSDIYPWSGIVSSFFGALIFLMIWLKKDILSNLSKYESGKERYWLIISLIITNLFFLYLMVTLTTMEDKQDTFSLLRIIMGLTFVYLVMTSLFRIYPFSFVFDRKESVQAELSQDDLDVLHKFEALMDLEKVYQEATYSRTELARELGVSEGTISRIINTHYQKSLPQILNEYRVKDAKQLLLETNASIKVVSEEVGFNSLPSFNRVFKEITGQSPSEYRKYTVK